MPATAEQAASQRARWEGGRYRLLRERALPLLAEGLRRRSRLLLRRRVRPAAAPAGRTRGAVVALGRLSAVGTAHLRLVSAPAAWAAAWAAGGAGLLLYILGGLRVAEAPRAAYAALARAPFYAVWKFCALRADVRLPAPHVVYRRNGSARTASRRRAGRNECQRRGQGRVSIVLPIVFFAVGMGLSVRRMTPRLWALLVAWIALVIAYNYVKPQAVTAAGGAPGAAAGSDRRTVTSSGVPVFRV